MQSQEWKRQPTLFPSFRALLQAVTNCSAKLEFQALQPNAGDEELLAKLRAAEKMLKAYFFFLRENPANKPVGPSDVIAAFASFEESARNRKATTPSPASLHASVIALFADPDAVAEASRDLRISSTELLQDELL
ncbi:MAG: hypothetical protein V4735_08925 [Pseudomonadota bacterium]